MLAATDHLVITYAARDERTNLRRPPAVPLGELLDVVDRTARFPVSRRSGSGWSSSTRCSRSTCATSTRVRWCLSGRGASTASRSTVRRRWRDGQLGAPPFLAGPLPRERGARDRARRAGQRSSSIRCGRSFAGGSASAAPRATTIIDDALSVELDALEQWSVGERLLEARLTGADRDASIIAEIARGELPPDLLAEPVLARVYPVVEELVAAARETTSRTPRPAPRRRAGWS